MRMNGLVGNLKSVVDNHYYLYEDFEGYIDVRPYSGNIILDNDVDKLLISNRIRPAWEYPDGNITFIDGYCKINKGESVNRRLYTKTTKNIGTWSFRVKVSENITQSEVVIAFIYQGGNDYLCVQIAANRYIFLKKKIGGAVDTLITSNFQLTLDTFQIITVTRNDAGEFELFIDNVSMGTIQDSDEPTTNYIHFNNLSDADFYLSYIKVT